MNIKKDIAVMIYLCLISISLYAQKEERTSSEKKDIIKVNLPALAFKNISVQYERQVGARTSLALNVHTIPFGNLAFQNLFEKLIDQNFVQYDKFKLGTFGVVPEFRYYVGRHGALHGFYIGPFISYNTAKMNLPISYNNNTKTGIFDGNLNTITGGLQFGAQFRLSKSLTLDWWIFGPNYGSGNGTLNFTAALTSQEQADLQTELDKIKQDAPLNTIKSAVATNQGATIVAKGPWGGLRGLGLSLGIKF